MKKYGTKYLVSLFIAALLLRILFVFESPVKGWDETVYANLGYDLSKNPLDYSFARKWSDYVPGDWPKAGFRAPLLPYILSIVYLGNSQILVDLFIPLIGALSIFIVYLLAKALFNKKVALYASLLFVFLPIHVVFSGKILTDVFSTFFITLSILFFWYGFEKRKNTYKMLFGVFLALSLLARYTTLLIIPIFPIYLILRHRNLSFLRDKFIWASICLFFVTLLPWFFYGTIEYNNPLGPFLHAQKARSYWGGTEPWYFFLQYSLSMFSILSIIFLIALVFIACNKVMRKNYAVIFLLIWFFSFFIFISMIPHKEDRFILPITPPLVILSALFLNNLRKYKKTILILVVLILAFSTGYQFYQTAKKSYVETNLCFLEANKFLQNVEKNALIITDESPIIYFYTKLETHFYPRPFNLYNLKNLINTYYKNRPVYVLFTQYDMPLDNEENVNIKNMLDYNFEIVFRCPESGNSSLVYKYS